MQGETFNGLLGSSLRRRRDLLATRSISIDLDAEAGCKLRKRKELVDLDSEPLHDWQNDNSATELRCPLGSLTTQRKGFTDSAALYASAIQKIRKRNEGKDLKELDVEEICRMGSEVRQALTNLQNELDLLQIAKKRMFDLSVAESKLNVEAELRAVAAADRAKFETEKVQVAAAAREEAKACIICMEKPHDVVIFPCLHAHCCSECLVKQRVTSNSCPTCRTTIMSTLRYLL